jgi:hypothetical protein
MSFGRKNMNRRREKGENVGERGRKGKKGEKRKTGGKRKKGERKSTVEREKKKVKINAK